MTVDDFQKELAEQASGWAAVFSNGNVGVCQVVFPDKDVVQRWARKQLVLAGCTTVTRKGNTVVGELPSGSELVYTLLPMLFPGDLKGTDVSIDLQYSIR